MIEQAPALDRHWHLGQNQEELISAGFEYALMRCIESFNDWQAGVPGSGGRSQGQRNRQCGPAYHAHE